MATLIEGTSAMSMQKTYGITTSVISSQVSAGGRSPAALQDSPTISPSGREAAPASLSPQPGDKKAKEMIATFGPHGSGSLKSQKLQSLLESRLQTQLPWGGWMKPALIWKAKATPWLRRYCQLAVSPKIIKEIGSGLWATPNTMDSMALRSPEAMTRQFNTTRKGRTAPSNLREQVAPAMWPTARVTTNGGAGNAERGFAKARLEDGAASVAMWATASARDWKDTPGMAKRSGKRSRMDQLPRQIPSGSSALTGSTGALNPEFVCWLMGYPEGWESYAVSETRSSRNSVPLLYKML